MVGGDRLGGLDDAEVALGRPAVPRLLPVVARDVDPAPLRRRLVAPVAARQEAGAERAPRQHAEPGGAAERQQVELDRALDERVLRLQRDERRPALAVLDRDGPGEQPGGEVRRAERPHLAGADERVERLQRRLERDRRVGRVHLVEVDHVGAEPAQARVAGRRDPLRRQALARRVGGAEAHLGREHHLVAMAREPRRERLLRAAVGVRVGRVEERAARLPEAVEHALGLVVRRRRAHEHRAEAHPADGERAEGRRLHPRRLPAAGCNAPRTGRRVGRTDPTRGEVMHRRGLGAAIALVVLLAVPTVASAATKTVQAGPAGATGGEARSSGAESVRRRRRERSSARRSRSTRATASSGRSTASTTCCSRRAASEAPGLIMPVPGSRVSGAVDAAGQPFWFNGNPEPRVQPGSSRRRAGGETLQGGQADHQLRSARRTTGRPRPTS